MIPILGRGPSLIPDTFVKSPDQFLVTDIDALEVGVMETNVTINYDFPKDMDEFTAQVGIK